MKIQVKKYTAKPVKVEAVQITEANMEAVAEWCGGTIRTSEGKRFIKVKVYRAMNEKQTMGFVGSWILKRGGTWKVYLDQAFRNSYTDDSRSIPLDVEPVSDEGSVFKSMLDERSKPKTTELRLGNHDATFTTPPAGVPMRGTQTTGGEHHTSGIVRTDVEMTEEERDEYYKKIEAAHVAANGGETMIVMVHTDETGDNA